jgi:nitroreductase
MSEEDQVAPDALLDMIRSRRSVRRYLPDPVPDEVLQKILEAGRWAPSANNQQPWAFIVVQDEQIRAQVAKHATYYLARRGRVDEAPLLIVLCAHARRRRSGTPPRQDVSMAAMQMMLEAKALGVGTCWIDGLERDEIAQILRVPPYLEIIGLLAVGYPAETPPETPRKPLFEIVHYDLYESVTFGDTQGGK